MSNDMPTRPAASRSHWPYTIVVIALIVGFMLLRGRFGDGDPSRAGSGTITLPNPGVEGATRSSRAPPNDGSKANGAATAPPSAASAPRSTRPTGNGATAADAGGEQRLGKAIAKHESSVWVEVECDVVKLLPDDTETPKHQKFLVEVVSGDTLLVAHNIDTAPRVPLKVGQSIVIRGRYEWSDKGGLLHFTHRDSDKGRPRGWIEAGGRRYE